MSSQRKKNIHNRVAISHRHHKTAGHYRNFYRDGHPALGATYHPWSRHPSREASNIKREPPRLITLQFKARFFVREYRKRGEGGWGFVRNDAGWMASWVNLMEKC